MALPLFNTYSKMQEERDKFKELFSKRNQNLKIWKTLTMSIIQQNKEDGSEENIKGVAKQPFDKEISMGMNHKYGQ